MLMTSPSAASDLVSTRDVANMASAGAEEKYSIPQ